MILTVLITMSACGICFIAGQLSRHPSSAGEPQHDMNEVDLAEAHDVIAQIRQDLVALSNAFTAVPVSARSGTTHWRDR